MKKNTHITVGTAMIYMEKGRNHHCFVESFDKGWAKITYDPTGDGLRDKAVRAKALAVLTADFEDLPAWLAVLIGNAAIEANPAPTGLIERAQAVGDSIKAPEAEDEEELPDGYRRFGKVRFKPVRYSVTKIDKKRYYDTNDDVAEELRGYGRPELAQLFADTLDSTDISFWPKSLKKAWDKTGEDTTIGFVYEKYGKLNDGMFRMTIGNVIRGMRSRQSEEGLMEAL